MLGNVMYCKIVIVLEWNFNLNTRETSEKVALSVLLILLSLLLQPQHSSPSATAFVSFGHCIRLLQLSHSSPSATAFVSFSHRSRMCQLNEVDEVVKWSGWVRIMKFRISAQLSIHRNGKVKRSLFLLFLILLPTSVKFLTKSGYFSLFNSEIEWNIRENL